jgi:DNA-binding MarR family transcriptional regulator
MLNEQVKNVDNFFCFNVRKYSRKTTKFFDEHLKKIGIRSTQIYLLLAISEGNKNITEISEELGLDRTTLTRGLTPLDRLGLIIRRDTGNKLSKVYVLTEYGQAMAQKGSALLQEAQNVFVSHVGNERYKRLAEDLSS